MEDVKKIQVTSQDLRDGKWDDSISFTDAGQNASPELTWDSIEGAGEYAVYMIDEYDTDYWLHWRVSGIGEPGFEHGENSGEYVGPYPPKGNPHTYAVFVFALAGEPGDVTLSFDSSGNTINNIFAGFDTDANGNTGNVIAYGRLDGNFTLF